MSVNKYLPHIFILPEDDANRQLANGFLLGIVTRQIYVLAGAGGWARVGDRFTSDHIGDMRKFTSRLMILLLDFDNDLDRLQRVKKLIPTDLTDRVFVLGTLTEPEGLRQASLGTYETIGKTMADDCRNGVRTIWKHDLLKHNQSELNRLSAVCGF